MKVLIFGTFDDLHPGHESYITQALERGEVTAIVARDANVLRFKGRAPLQDEETRRAAIERLFPGVTAVLGDPDDFLAPVRAANPDVILLGYDQKLPPGMDPAHLRCGIERAESFQPEIHKSSIRRAQQERASADGSAA
jgi:FAD synthetase